MARMRESAWPAPPPARDHGPGTMQTTDGRAGRMRITGDGSECQTEPGASFCALHPCSRHGKLLSAGLRVVPAWCMAWSAVRWHDKMNFKNYSPCLDIPFGVLLLVPLTVD